MSVKLIGILPNWQHSADDMTNTSTMQWQSALR